MTYNVFGGTLSLAQSISHYVLSCFYLRVNMLISLYMSILLVLCYLL